MILAIITAKSAVKDCLTLVINSTLEQAGPALIAHFQVQPRSSLTIVMACNELKWSVVIALLTWGMSLMMDQKLRLANGFALILVH